MLYEAPLSLRVKEASGAIPAEEVRSGGSGFDDFTCFVSRRRVSSAAGSLGGAGWACSRGRCSGDQRKRYGGASRGD